LLVNKLYSEARSLSKNDAVAFEKSSHAVKELGDLKDSNAYRHIDDSSKQRLIALKKEIESYTRTLTPPLPSDLSNSTNIKSIELSKLAYGSSEAISQQKEWVSKLALPLEVKTKQTGIKLRLIPPGVFSMGSPTNEVKRDSDETQHQVIIADAFYCSKFEISQKQWMEVMVTNPSSRQGSNKPVENISLKDCREFVKKLCTLENVPAGTYRLINEEQWEYACRAGTSAPSYLKAGVNVKNSNINWKYQDEEIDRDKMTMDCEKYSSNAFGLYDMYGNVFEICNSPFISYSKKNDSKALKKKNDYFVIRGGSFNNGPKMCRSAYRSRIKLNEKDDATGFRIIRIIKKKR